MSQVCVTVYQTQELKQTCVKIQFFKATTALQMQVKFFRIFRILATEKVHFQGHTLFLCRAGSPKPFPSLLHWFHTLQRIF